MRLIDLIEIFNLLTPFAIAAIALVCRTYDNEKVKKSFLHRVTLAGWIVVGLAALSVIFSFWKGKIEEGERLVENELTKRYYDSSGKQYIAKALEDQERSFIKKLSDAGLRFNPSKDSIVKIKPSITQRIERAGSGIQNNSPNYGPQAGRDQYNYGTLPRIISEKEIMDSLHALPKGILINFVFVGQENPEMVSVKEQITKILIKNGYNNISPANITAAMPGVAIKRLAFNLVNDDSLEILIPQVSP